MTVPLFSPFSGLTVRRILFTGSFFISLLARYNWAHILSRRNPQRSWLRVIHDVQRTTSGIKIFNVDFTRVNILDVSGIDMSRDFYAHIETGDYNIRVSELAALRKIYRCSYDDIFLGF